MSLDQSDKLSSDAEAVRPPRRSRAAIWPMDTGASEDTFATPSKKPTGEIDPAHLVGPEPAVFGGTNPNAAGEDGAVATEAASEASAEQALVDPLGTPLDEAVRGDEMLPEAPQINYRRLFRSTPFLLTSMICLLIAAQYIVEMVIETECYVQMSVKFSNYTRLSEAELAELDRDVKARLQTIDLRKAAWEIVKKQSPDVDDPGFLNSGLAFYRPDAIKWSPDGTLRLRVDSEDPASDITRIMAVTGAFYDQLKERGEELAEYTMNLLSLQELQAVLQAQDAELKMRAEGLLPEALRYGELKKAQQADERYLELADSTNPLRLVATEKLKGLRVQLELARAKSVEHDDLLKECAAIEARLGSAESDLNTRTAQMDDQQKVPTIQDQIAALKRKIEVFAFPEAPNKSQWAMPDTRGHQTLILNIVRISIIAFFGGLIGVFHLIDARENRRLRAERRALLAKASRAK